MYLGIIVGKHCYELAVWALGEFKETEVGKRGTLNDSANAASVGP